MAIVCLNIMFWNLAGVTAEPLKTASEPAGNMREILMPRF